MAADALGVGKLGEQQQSVPLMLSAKTTGSQSERKYRVTDSFKLVSHSPPRPGSIAAGPCWVFSDHNSRANPLNNADEFTAKALLALVSKSGDGVALTWVASADDVDSPMVSGDVSLNVGRERSDGATSPGVRELQSRRREGSHVAVSTNIGPVFGENSGCIVVNLHLPFADHSGPLKPKIETADARE